MTETFKEWYDKHDTNYRGPKDENGNLWDADMEWYELDTDTISYRVFKETDDFGPWKCVQVLIGTPNVKVTVGDEKKSRGDMTDQEWYQWLWDNRRLPDLGYDEITRSSSEA